MPRRASSNINLVHLIGAAVVVLIVIVAGRLLLKGESETSISGSEMDIDVAVESANSLRGNEYVVEGKLDDRLRWDRDAGQVISLKVDGEKDSKFIAIEIPPELTSINLEREQNYSIKVRIREGGIAVAEEIARR